VNRNNEQYKQIVAKSLNDRVGSKPEVNPFKKVLNPYILLFAEEFSKPNTKNKQSLEVLHDVRKRVNSEEGKRRLKNLVGDNYEARLNELNSFDIKDDKKTIAHYFKVNSNVHINPFLSNKVRKGVTRHEIEHVIQKGELTDIDKDLENLDIRYNDTENPFGKDNHFKEDQNEEYYRNISANYHNEPNLPDYLKSTANYFKYGSQGKEKSAFLAEMQQWVLDNNLVKHPYDVIDADKVKQFYIEYQFNKNYPLGIFDIIKPNKKNFEIIAENYNKLLSTLPLLVGGMKSIDMMNKNSKKEEMKKLGGKIYKYQFGGVVSVVQPKGKAVKLKATIDTPTDKNIVLGGQRHEEGNNKLGKGNPVYSCSSNTCIKVAETEVAELLLTKTTTQEIDKLLTKYKKGGNIEDLIKLGKYFSEQINKNTINKSV